MALAGTLKDFGIADILQLIAQQQKTGVLHLRSKDQEVKVGFVNGAIVSAESVSKKKRDLFGHMLVAAELITEAQLELALETQKRSLQRLGDCLISQGVLTKDQYRRMAQLQFNETLYRLFTWKTGTYEFEQGPVHHDTHDLEPVRAESVLMEGFRMVDEWPVIRKRIPRYDLVFASGKFLPPDGGTVESAGEFASIGPSERRLYALVNGYRDVRKLIDLSCLGEFETCKALCNLSNLGHVTALIPVGEPDLPEDDIGLGDRLRGAVGRLAVSMVVLAGIVGVVLGTQLNPWAVRSSAGAGFAEGVLRQQISRAQVSRIEGALAVYRLERGDVPTSLEALVDQGLLSSTDVQFPWAEHYYYRRVGPQEFILLPPLR
ncbi:MAG TPA: DUF4388 domain-containing protein [Myxococcaceae bacterium]|jgi:hypothetical protein